jgi:RHS repeat-associated protein
LTLFGKDLSEKPLSPWRFCGKRHEEAALGIIDFGYRFYHPKSAQWLTQDPLGESDGPNLYAYVKNNPACYVDKFGLYGDGFSFSSAWDSFKETCSNCWDTVTDYCSSRGASDYCGDISNTPTDYCSWIDNKIDNQVVDFGDGHISVLSEQGGTLGSLALDCTPVVGSIKSAGEFIVGQDLITGEETSRCVALVGLIPFGKALTNAGKGLNKIVNVSAKVFRGSKARKVLSFTEGNFRKNLKAYTGISPGKNQHAHHVIPKEFADRLAEKGINVHDPKYGVWWEATEHWSAHGKSKYNDEWYEYLDTHTHVNKEEICEFGRNIMNKYGKNVYF